MDMNNDGKKKFVSMLEGDGLYSSCILSRESSIGQSFQSYHRRAVGVVPFKWELLPGTPKNMPDEDILPPLSPPPSVLNSSLPKPCFDQLQSRKPYRLERWLWRKLKSINKKGHMSRGKGMNESCQAGESNGDFGAIFECSSSSSSSTYNSSHLYSMESSNLRGGELHDGPFCCSSWNITLILDEDNKKIYYCRVHRTAFTLDNSPIMITSAPSLEEPSFRSYYRSSTSTSNGIPFGWEMQPGTPIHPPETEVIPPPSPPPAFQGSGLSLPNFQLTDHPRRRTLMSFFGDKGKEMQQNNNSVETSFDDVDKETRGTSCTTPVWKSKGLSKLSRFSKKPIGGQFCVIPRTLS